MSYCRWSSDDWRSDLYIYEASDGYYIHVARNRKPQAFFDAIPVPLSYVPFAAQFERGQQIMAMLDDYESEPIGLPHDGETLILADAEETARAVEWLAAVGYYVPAGTADAIRDDEP